MSNRERIIELIEENLISELGRAQQSYDSNYLNRIETFIKAYDVIVNHHEKNRLDSERSETIDKAELAAKRTTSK